VKRFLSALLVSSLVLLSGTPALAAGAAPAPVGATASAPGDENLNIAGKRARIVARSAIYGFGGGLVVGVASQVFKKKSKNILLFGSLGLYAGILLGVYVITTSSTPPPYEGPDTYDDFSLNQGAPTPVLMALSRQVADVKKTDLKVSLLNLQF
jgi:hypothetical protein